MSKQIPLSRGLFATVDDADYDDLVRFKWHVLRSGYAGRNIWKDADGRRNYEYMHVRIAGTTRGKHTDHINGDRLDNRRDNLRVCTPSQNAGNAKLRKDNKVGLKGAYYHKQSGKWYSRLQHQGKNVTVPGMFATAQEAHFAYLDMAVKLRGEYASIRNANP